MVAAWGDSIRHMSRKASVSISPYPPLMFLQASPARLPKRSPSLIPSYSPHSFVSRIFPEPAPVVSAWQTGGCAIARKKVALPEQAGGRYRDFDRRSGPCARSGAQRLDLSGGAGERRSFGAGISPCSQENAKRIDRRRGRQDTAMTPATRCWAVGRGRSPGSDGPRKTRAD